MFTGGATGSTAGGIKVNTFGLLVVALWSTLRGQENVVAFKREIDGFQIRRAMTIALLSFLLIIVAMFILGITEEARFLHVMFEAVSAFGTVGLSTGLTLSLSIAGKAVVAATIFAGRLGPITIAAALLGKERSSSYRNPRGTIRLG
jgi:trk system potassium uptake protein TrkH